MHASGKGVTGRDTSLSKNSLKLMVFAIMPLIRLKAKMLLALSSSSQR